MLSARLGRPLVDSAAIGARLDAVDWFMANRSLRGRLRDRLKGSADMARALSRLALGRGGPRDLGALRDGLKAGELMVAEVLTSRGADGSEPPPHELARALEALTPSLFPELARFLATLSEGLGTDLPAQARDGGFVAPGTRPELDQTRALRDDSRRVVAGLEQALAAETGVPLKIKHNGVLGYFVEVTAKQADALFQPVRETLATLRAAQDKGLERALQREAEAQAMCYAGKDFLAGVEGVATKTRPVWQQYK
jgi:DNA mismatch repair protein MutS